MSALALYRQSKLGECLVDSLDQLINEQKITPDLAIRILEEFDKSLVEAMQTKVVAKCNFKGKLNTYRFCDNVWTFIVSDATFKNNVTGTGPSSAGTDVHSNKIKIVCVDAKLLQPADT